MLIYMNADNNLEPDALVNFQQMARIGSTPQVNLVVEFDRIKKYAHTSPDWSQTLRFRVTKDMKPLPAFAVQDLGERNMGDPSTLGDFVHWGMSQYPANHYMLVIWDHGQGWRLFMTNLLKRGRAVARSRALGATDSTESFRSAAVLLRNSEGIASAAGDTAPFRSAPGDAYRSASNDETDGDVLYNSEIHDGLKNVLGDARLDVVGFDACLMSMAETGYALRDVASYLVASEELEPGLGWNYETWLRAITNMPAMDAAAVARVTVTSYAATYRDNDPTTTLSATDLTKMPKVASALTDLSDHLMRHLDDDIQALVEARQATSVYAPGYGFYHVDLVHIMNELGARSAVPATKAKAAAVRAAVQAAIIETYAGSERSGGSYGSFGLAIYFPDSETQHVNDAFSEGGYEKNNTYFPVEFVQREHWADFLHAYWERVP